MRRPNDRADEPGPPPRTGELMDFVRDLIARSGGRFWTICTLIAVSGALDALRMLLLVPMLDLLSGRTSTGLSGRIADAGRSVFDGGATITRMLVLAALFVGFTCLRALVLYARDIESARLRVNVVTRQRTALMRQIGHAAWPRLALLDHPRVTSVIGGETQRTANSIDTLTTLLSLLTVLIVQIAVSLSIAPLPALALIVGIGLPAAFVASRRRRTTELGDRHSRANADSAQNAAHFLASLKAVVAQDAQDSFLTAYERSEDDARSSQLDFARHMARRNLFASLGMAFAVALMLLLAASWFADRISVLLALLVLLSRMVMPLGRIQVALQTLSFALSGHRALVRMSDELREDTAPADRPAEVPPPGPIVLERVTYLHAGGGGVREIDLTLQPGEFVGIVGPSGQGKTTLIDCLSGLLEPQSGTLCIGGLAIDSPARRRGWRRRIAYVTQDGLLLDRSLRHNLSWGDARLTDADMRDALATAGGAPLLARLGGLDARIGERGALLSGGERQRVAIARALLRRPRLLLLDEATSAVDIASEADLLDRLAALDPRPAILLVTHRAESLRWCERVIAIRGGRIAKP